MKTWRRAKIVSSPPIQVRRNWIFAIRHELMPNFAAPPHHPHSDALEEEFPRRLFISQKRERRRPLISSPRAPHSEPLIRHRPGRCPYQHGGQKIAKTSDAKMAVNSQGED
ncbi:hypothetical protein CEXT_539471 [Caerostris extrusa]|uniref:Uncharacterized protein n=1 Tax=Caerostris extrusa TaxID=172846 RepID=A0AAV4RP54_CAEEX|nr:hypothetical protein CEXT_539471 [Caerostris extrusa]